jgi:hypothetical protein
VGGAITGNPAAIASIMNDGSGFPALAPSACIARLNPALPDKVARARVGRYRNQTGPHPLGYGVGANSVSILSPDRDLRRHA